MRKARRIGSLVLHGIDRISGWFGLLTGIIYGCLTFLVCADVIGRYLFDAPIVWTFDVTLILNVAIGWGAAAYVLREGGHIEVTIITDLFSPKTRELVKAIMSFVGMFLCIFFTWSAWIILGRSLKIAEATETLAIPLPPVRIFMLIGVALLGLQFVSRIINAFRAWHSLSVNTRSKQAADG